MPRTSDIVLGGRLMAMFKGDNGTGKTAAAGSFPGPIKFFVFDGHKLDVLKMFYPDRTDIEYDIYGPTEMRARDPLGNPVHIKSLIQFAEEYTELQTYCPWATVVIDSFTTFCNTCITFQLGVRTADNKGTGLSKGGLVIPDFDEYKGETTLVTQTLDVSKVLPCHVIWTAHPLPRLETTGKGANMQVTKSSSIASYGAKIAAMAPSYFNEIWHFTASGGGVSAQPQRQLYTVNTGMDFAKTGLPLPPVMDIAGKRTYRVIMEELEKHNIRLQERIAAQAASDPRV